MNLILDFFKGEIKKKWANFKWAIEKICQRFAKETPNNPSDIFGIFAHSVAKYLDKIIGISLIDELIMSQGFGEFKMYNLFCLLT